MSDQESKTPPSEQANSKPAPIQPAVSDDHGSRQIPGYQILEKLGAGAMAVVFKAKQLSLNRMVAIKVLPKKLSADKEYVERFYAEGEAAAKLNHTNIVQAFDVGEAQGYHYFVMEYVEGKTVYDELAAGKIYSENEALDITIQIARALQHAHDQGLIHRDVKPKNIMLTEGGVAKLMDMGLARVADDSAAIAAEAGRLFGTPYYISPEQIIGKATVDFSCDIYGLGATLYHMVTGHVPFDGDTPKKVMLKHLKEKLTPPDRHNLELSFGICKLIEKMLAKHPQNRHKTTQKLLEDLQSVDFLLEVQTPESISTPLSSLEQHTDTSTPPPPPPELVETQATANQPSTDTLLVEVQKSPANKLLLIGLLASLILNIVLLVVWLLK
ncbi:MAG: serine/threonine protein kinase [Phycisphaerae bacterium]|nr:serine/threonine protein kinase [Phycisphaerae bacterium]